MRQSKVSIFSQYIELMKDLGYPIDPDPSFGKDNWTQPEANSIDSPVPSFTATPAQIDVQFRLYLKKDGTLPRTDPPVRPDELAPRPTVYTGSRGGSYVDKRFLQHAHRETYEDVNKPAHDKVTYGGIIFDSEGRVLVREPKNHYGGLTWSLAKGHANEGETPEEAAIREVGEETGIRCKIIGDVPGHYSSENGSSKYFMMEMEDDFNLDTDLGDFSEETESIDFVDPEEALQRFQHDDHKTGNKKKVENSSLDEGDEEEIDELNSSSHRDMEALEAALRERKNKEDKKNPFDDLEADVGVDQGWEIGHYDDLVKELGLGLRKRLEAEEFKRDKLKNISLLPDDFETNPDYKALREEISMLLGQVDQTFIETRTAIRDTRSMLTDLCYSMSNTLGDLHKSWTSDWGAGSESKFGNNYIQMIQEALAKKFGTPLTFVHGDAHTPDINTSGELTYRTDEQRDELIDTYHSFLSGASSSGTFSWGDEYNFDDGATINTWRYDITKADIPKGTVKQGQEWLENYKHRKPIREDVNAWGHVVEQAMTTRQDRQETSAGRSDPTYIREKTDLAIDYLKDIEEFGELELEELSESFVDEIAGRMEQITVGENRELETYTYGANLSSSSAANKTDLHTAWRDFSAWLADLHAEHGAEGVMEAFKDISKHAEAYRNDLDKDMAYSLTGNVYNSGYSDIDVFLPPNIFEILQGPFVSSTGERRTTITDEINRHSDELLDAYTEQIYNFNQRMLDIGGFEEGTFWRKTNSFEEILGSGINERVREKGRKDFAWESEGLEEDSYELERHGMLSDEEEMKQVEAGKGGGFEVIPRTSTLTGWSTHPEGYDVSNVYAIAKRVTKDKVFLHSAFFNTGFVNELESLVMPDGKSARVVRDGSKLVSTSGSLGNKFVSQHQSDKANSWQKRKVNGKWTSGHARLEPQGLFDDDEGSFAAQADIPDRKSPITKPDIDHSKVWTEATGDDDELVTKLGKTQFGSQPGGLKKDPNTGKLHYVKHANSDQNASEHLANNIYRAAGIPVPDSQLIKWGNVTAIAGEWLPDVERYEGDTDPSEFLDHRDVKDGYLVDIMLANWDVVGLDFDNIVSDNKKDRFVRIDNGSALTYRAQGGTKPNFHDWDGAYIPELEQMVTNTNNTSVQGIGSNMQPEDWGRAHGKILKLTNSKIKALVSESGLSQNEHEEMITTLIQRRNNILEWIGDFQMFDDAPDFTDAAKKFNLYDD